MCQLQNLQTYIKAELSDAALYKSLANAVQNDTDKMLLMEISNDEQSHADEFKSIYRMITGQCIDVEAAMPVTGANVREILRDRVLDESGDYRKYGMEYLKTTGSIRLKNAFYRARTDEGVHAWRLLYMLCK